MHDTMSLRLATVVAIFATFASACRHGEPPTPEVDASVSELPAQHAPDGGRAILNVARDAGAERAGDASSDAGLGADAAEDAGALPQTRDKPRSDAAAFDARMRALFDGIVRDDPDAAIVAFFPLAAYAQVKAIPTPARDWRYRLVAAYKRDIHALHATLGERGERARYLRTEVQDGRARWVEPNEETNAIGYYRVYGTRLVYELDGREQSFGISSLISWRGEWYVVHLTGFK